ncbi:hypothetical protein BDA99DRAFT_541254 [Phascolomyces articulosus]|uniref:Uncharacterized protein n=1 Tax=Phascolomyces articulosus TaxID=60185 RepID=A0AAD5JS74_9FUNG|nr:hypothetical protein BDA99DRAFT_541254 [Phascolomyces articulosus]
MYYLTTSVCQIEALDFSNCYLILLGNSEHPEYGFIISRRVKFYLTLVERFIKAPSCVRFRDIRAFRKICERNTFSINSFNYELQSKFVVNGFFLYKDYLIIDEERSILRQLVPQEMAHLDNRLCNAILRLQMHQSWLCHIISKINTTQHTCEYQLYSSLKLCIEEAYEIYLPPPNLIFKCKMQNAKNVYYENQHASGGIWHIFRINV